jgi:3-phosphoglycerate kinase
MSLTPSLSGIRTLRDLEVADKRVFVRLDLNVPLSDAGEIVDDRGASDCAIPHGE